MNFVPFGERSLKMATQLYAHCANWPCVIKTGIMHAFIKVSFFIYRFLLTFVNISYLCQYPPTRYFGKRPSRLNAIY